MTTMAISSLKRVESEMTPPETPDAKSQNEDTQPDEVTTKICASKTCVHKHEEVDAAEKKKTTKSRAEDSESESSSDESDSSSSDEDENEKSSSESDSEEDKKKKKTKKSKSKSKSKKDSGKSKQKKTKKHKKNKKASQVKDEEKEKEDVESDTEEEKIKDTTTNNGTPVSLDTLKSQFSSLGYDMSDKSNKRLLKFALEGLKKTKAESEDDSASSSDTEKSDGEKQKKKKSKKAKRASKAEFKRLDEIWDEDSYSYRLKETSEEQKKDEYEEYIFTVRRKFDSEGHYEETVVDIKSQPLIQCLQKVMSGVECVSLVEETPSVEPHLLFLFNDEFKAYIIDLKKERKTAKKRKVRKQTALKAKYLEVLVNYLDKDYDKTKKTLDPLVKNGRISFDLMWALYKPNTLAYTATYGDDDHPRAFKIDSCYKHKNCRGVYYEIEGKYLDYDGKNFGTAQFAVDVFAFKGTRKITSLSCYPLERHADIEALKPKLLERGKKFLTLAGMNYKSCTGVAFVKAKSKVLKTNINGRIMVDPKTFRRTNPNYPLEEVEPRTIDDDEDLECSCENSDSKVTKSDKKEKKHGKYFRLIKPEKEDQKDQEEAKVLEIKAEEQEEFEKHIDSAEKEKDLLNTFSEEDLLTAAPVIPGFSFSEKVWVEFTVSSITDISWNAGAFDSLVLPEKHKSIVKALVSAHGIHGAKGFDDIIAGKGKGLVAVLHGRPGLGKTLTCEAVSDLLKRPLYTVSAGDLGTNPSQLEHELQTILDIAHTWGAVLLMDEADVFLEERSIHDIHRNALVSIFLRLLEYFQGILFLTTNRVETFDEAFVSRIHLSLRYNDLTIDAKRSVWKTFIDKVRATEGMEVDEITEKDYSQLARCEVNGRQIKNLVKTAQALALHENVAMSMNHIRRVIEVARSFEMDLKGGSGFEDAMRSYT